MSDTTSPEAKKNGKSPVILIAAALVLAAGTGAGAFLYARRGAPVEKAKPAERGVVGFEPFVVNLADANASRFLRVSVQLVVKNAEDAEAIHQSPATLMAARSAILEVLTLQTSDRLVTPEGKAELKKAIAERAGAAMDEMKVIDVLFSDFVVQF